MKVKAAEYTTSYGKKMQWLFFILVAPRLLVDADYEGTLSNMLAAIKCLSPVRHSLIVVTKKSRALFRLG